VSPSLARSASTVRSLTGSPGCCVVSLGSYSSSTLCTTESELKGLASRFVRSGAPAVAAPLGLCGLQATGRFTGALTTGLVDGEPIHTATQSARRAVRKLGLAHPDSR
jgi:hypothetical protein